ncbi:hypothetical protein GW17_00023689 [Ensete ventricosum]|nr:hypothetical protein GW17_00023689 [Ensete ventricosum]
MGVTPVLDGNQADSSDSNAPEMGDAQSTSTYIRQRCNYFFVPNYMFPLVFLALVSISTIMFLHTNMIISVHPPPAFGSSPNLEALALEANRQQDHDGDSVANAPQFLRLCFSLFSVLFYVPMHEIAFSTHDKPKLLSLLTSFLAELGLNIQEAHAFSTNDGYSLDVFVVDGWPYEVLTVIHSAFFGTLCYLS